MLKTLAGAPALSPARLARLRAESGVGDAFAEFVHFLLLDRELTPAEWRVAKALLAYGPRRHRPAELGALFCLVTPRLGTVSPWSSKATDIFHRCGLDAVSRVERGVRWYFDGAPPADLNLLHDRMTETVALDGRFDMGRREAPRPLTRVALDDDAPAALAAANTRLGLALSAEEMRYLADTFATLRRAPTDAELMMFAQANSEHCRHKIFNAAWRVDGADGERAAAAPSLFDRIRRTHSRINGEGVLSAYVDNAAVVVGNAEERFAPDADRVYRRQAVRVHRVMKVETHNHPTAISPFPGAATGAGGEIRDEGAVGRGSKPKAGLVGFTTSHLNLTEQPEPWELRVGRPDRIAAAKEIMLHGPLGAAAFNNEFGRPCLAGYFRTFEAESHRPGETWGYHKPVMIAGGVGSVAAGHVAAAPVPVGAKLVVLGGPSMLIGLGGGAASSMASGAGDADLDFASVQRANADMQRRCQEVIDRCCALGEDNPIRLIHDVGAGGLSNALPELLREAGVGGRLDLRAVPSADPAMSPMEIWCNEAQERYALAIAPDALPLFDAICVRERCPYAVVGEATAEGALLVEDSALGDAPVDMPLRALLGDPPKQIRRFRSEARSEAPFDHRGLALAEAIDRVLRFPAVASKQFLVTIGDRSISGLVARDQMVGERQVPVADVAVTLADYRTCRGEAMAMGERAPLAVANPAASARMAIAEALTNLAAAPIDPRRIALSANWMAAAGHPGEDQALFEAVSAAGALCEALGIAIVVGKDSLSMRTTWHGRKVVSPVTLNVSAFAPVADVRGTLTPVAAGAGLWLVEPPFSRRGRLGGSALAQCHGALGEQTPDVDEPAALAALLRFTTRLHGSGAAACYHDRSDGGLLATLLEMAFAAGCGLDIAVDEADPLAALFAEEVGAVVGIADGQEQAARALAAEAGLAMTQVAVPRADDRVTIRAGGRELFAASRAQLQRVWASTSHAMQRLRDDPSCADEEFAAIDAAAPVLAYRAGYDPDEDVAAPLVGGARPRVAILREQGVNGQLEMAAAFDQAGFEAVDVHMSDLFAKPDSLAGFRVLAACGGFSYGDVLGGGGGWAKSILFAAPLRAAFAEFFARPDTLALGVCNGCQMFAALRELIPGASGWPRWVRNRSDQFEARTVLVAVRAGTSPWLAGMDDALLPVPVAHGEGRPEFDAGAGFAQLAAAGQVAWQYAHPSGAPTERYPANPNGAEQGLAAVTAAGGRVLAAMPHPERVFRAVQNSWVAPEWNEDGPWLRLFRNARLAFG